MKLYAFQIWQGRWTWQIYYG